MELRGSLAMLLAMWLFSSPIVVSLELDNSTLMKAQELDADLQNLAYQGFGETPETGKIYSGKVPRTLSGIKVLAVRLLYGNLMRKGRYYDYEFGVPVQVKASPYVMRLVLVYQNLGERGMLYYPLENHTHLGSVFGLRVYDGMDLMAKNPLALSIKVSEEPIIIKFPKAEGLTDTVGRKCASFYLNGTVQYSEVSAGNICKTYEQGHFSIVANTTDLPPNWVPKFDSSAGGHDGKKYIKVLKIVGLVIGGLALLVILVLLILWLCKFKPRKKMHRMEKAAAEGESLHMTAVGGTKAPAATGTRTQPSLETEYVP